MNKIIRMKFNKKLVFNIIITLITILIFIVLFYKFDFTKVIKIIKNADFFILSIAIFFSFVFTFVIIPFKWKLILDFINYNISFKEAFFIHVSSLPTSYIMPLKSGDLIKSLYLKRYNKLSFRKATSTLIFDNTMDLFILVLFSFSGLIFLFQKFSFETYLWFIITAFFFILILLIAKSVPSDLFHSFKTIPIRKTLIIFMFSLIGFFLGVFSVYLTLLSISIEMPFLGIMFYSPIIFLITMVPVTISGLGTREVSIILLLSDYAPPESLLSAGILQSFIVVVLPLLVSLFFLRRFYKRLLYKNA